MIAKCGCGGGSKKSFVFSCSGGADVGALADRTARRLDEKGTMPVYCLSGIGGRVSGILRTTEAADELLVIDGCPLQCGAATLREAGLERFHHVVTTDLGFTKGGTEITNEIIDRVTEMVETRLQDEERVQ